MTVAAIKRLAILLLAAAAGIVQAQCLVTEDILPFRSRDIDRYRTEGGGWMMYDADHHPLLDWKDNTKWMTVKYVSRPPLKPFKGAGKFELRFSRGEGDVEIEVNELGGASQVLTGKLHCAVAVIDAKLDSGKLYELGRIRLASDVIAPGKIRLEYLRSVRSSTQAQALAFEVETPTAYYVLSPGERPSFTVSNLSSCAVVWRGRIKLRDYVGNGFDIPIDLSLEANSTHKIRSPRVMPGMGLWRAVAEISGGDGSHSALECTTFAVLPKRKPTPPLEYGAFRMGTVCHVEYISDRDRKICCEALQAMGAKLVRCNLCMMGLVQPNGPEQFDFKLQDKMIDMFQAHGLAVDTILTWAPRWSFSEKHKRLSDRCGIGAITPQPEPFKRFCEVLARRYGTRIAYYETSNEVDARDSQFGNIDELIAFQRAGWEGVKASCPQAKVLTPGFGALSSDHPAIKMKGCQERICSEASDAYDVHAVHGHGPFVQYVERVEKLMEWRKAMGIGDKPWFPNETALTGCLGQEQEAAEAVWKKIIYSRSMGAVDYSWYNLRAKNWNPDDHEGGYGMMTSDFHPRASYCSFSALAGLVGECLEVLRLPSSRYRYFFTLKPSAKGLGKVMIFWDEDVVDSSWRLKIKTDAKHVHAVDLMGNRRKLECKDGIVEVEVSRRPAAIVFDDVSAVEPDAAALAAPRQGETPLEVIVRGLNDKAPPDVELSDRALVHDCYEAQFGYHDQLWKGAADLSAKVWFGRKAQGPYSIAVACELGIDVKDDIHTPGANKKAAGDSVLAALAFPGQNGHWIIHLADGADGGAKAEFKRVPRGFEISEASKTLIATVERIGNITRYRLVIPLSTLKASWSSDFCKGFRFNLLVRDDDGKGVESWIEPRPGTFRNADPRRFALIKYVRRKSSPESVSGSRKK